MRQDGMVVIKIGGSLMPHAGEIISVILQSGRNILIVPGGGIFAEQIRQQHISGTAAHWMAVAAMDQYGWYLSTYGIPVTCKPRFFDTPTVLLPYTHLLKTDPLPHSWDITSDTISAYFADLLSSPLIILKSVEFVRSKGMAVQTLTMDSDTGDLDPSFVPYIMKHGISGQIISGIHTDRLSGILRGDKVPGTRFGSTILEDDE
ncbi:MAG: uridylate kinase [Methanospirillum sp.]|nr:uridylate kinase [Methanospirillum sp.]